MSEYYPTSGAVHPVNWRSRYGGMEVSDVRKLRELEAENAKLKKLLAEAMLDIEALKVVTRGKR
jgi:putative transposase